MIYAIFVAYNVEMYKGMPNHRSRKEQMTTEKESAEDRFKRLAEKRTNAILKKLSILGNCSNRQVYSYSNEDIDRIFGVIERKVRETKARFKKPIEEEFRL
jgi:hypothetical protein